MFNPNFTYDYASCTRNGETFTFDTGSKNSSSLAFQIQTWSNSSYLDTIIATSSTGIVSGVLNKTASIAKLRFKYNGNAADACFYYDISDLPDGKYVIQVNVTTMQMNKIVIKNVMIEQNANNKRTSYVSSSTHVSSDTKVNDPFNRTLFAEWTPKTITITLNKNGGSGGTDKIYFKYNTNTFYSDANCTNKITKITLPTRIGHIFYRYTGDGTCGGTNGEWFIKDDGTFADDLHYDIYKDATLTAQWTKVPNVTGSATLTYYSSSFNSGYSGTVKCGGYDVQFSYQSVRGVGTYCAVYCTALGDSSEIKLPGKNNYSTSFSNVTVSGSQCTYTVSWNANTHVVTITISF